jgi:hypothetical protein
LQRQYKKLMVKEGLRPPPGIVDADFKIVISEDEDEDDDSEWLSGVLEIGEVRSYAATTLVDRLKEPTWEERGFQMALYT